MFYLVFAIFSLGTALLQSSYLRAHKGIIPTRRRYFYTVVAAVATSIQVLMGALRIDPAALGALLCIPIFFAVNKAVRGTSLRLRHTFRIGFIISSVTACWLIPNTWITLGL